MQRKVYVPGAVALLVALLAGCTGGSGADGGDDGKSGDSAGSTQAAEPGKYRTLPEPCGTVDRSTLDAMLPGIKEIGDDTQREKAYEGAATVTYDTDRRVGCRWKVESADATHHLLVDFERVVSYDGAVSDDSRAEEVYRRKLRDADIPEPTESEPGSDEPSDSSSPSASKGASDEASGDAKPQGGPSAEAKAGKGKKGDGAAKDDEDEDGGKDDDNDGDKGEDESDDSGEPSASGDDATPAGLEPRPLDDLGDEAFLDDVLTTAASASRHRTVTVVFRTSNVIVTVEYDEQPARRTEAPDSKEMQDSARELADDLSDRFDG
ncbi:DUF3558 domain-containing protein [Streptomyces sp. NPDC059063]|uniref:DUF3558 domain-containing protein n=1 Tax=unclassified Streptomyces TaxID=2593676 RepID=UPI00369E29D5